MKVSNVVPGSMGEDPLVNMVLVDVRSGAEFKGESIKGAKNVPLHKLSKGALDKISQPEDTLCFFCLSGMRSAQAIEQVEHIPGLTICEVEGGLMAWKEAGGAVVVGADGLSMERQVRIGAGVLVSLGVLLSVMVHSAWLILSGGVGLGLIYAGVSGSCGMAKVLGRMPWNQ